MSRDGRISTWSHARAADGGQTGFSSREGAALVSHLSILPEISRLLIATIASDCCDIK